MKAPFTERVAKACARKPWLVVLLWITIVGGSLAAAAAFMDSSLTTNDTFTNDAESQVGDDLLVERFPEASRVQETMLVLSDLTTDNPEYREFMDELATDLEGLGDDIVESTTHFFGLLTEFEAAGLPELGTAPLIQGEQPSTENSADLLAQSLPPEVLAELESANAAIQKAEANLISPDKTSALLLITMAGDEADAAANIEVLHEFVDEKDAESDEFQLLITGSATVNQDFNEAADRDLITGETIGIPTAMVILIIVFGTLAAAVLPLALAITAIVAAIGATALVGQIFQLSFFVINMITMMGLAVAIDYSLFIVSRYREERASGLSVDNAIAATGGTANRAVLFSGITVILAVTGLLLVPHNIFISLSAGAILVVTMSVIASLTLLPAVMKLMGDKMERLKLPGVKAQGVPRPDGDKSEDSNKGFWAFTTRIVMGHPAISLILSAGVLIAIASPILDLRVGSTFSVDGLPDGSKSKAAGLALEERFERDPRDMFQIIVDADTESQPVSDSLSALDEALQKKNIFESSEFAVNDQKDLGVLTVFLDTTPGGPEAIELIHELRDDIVPQAFENTDSGVYVAGQTPRFMIDFPGVASDATPTVIVFVLTLSFILLLLVFRSIVIPIKAIIVNLLSVAAAYGLIVMVFLKGVGAEFLGFTQVTQVEGWIPLFLFTILFGLSMDYQVFLLSRIREKYTEIGDSDASVAFGLRTTGRIITGAALIMVAVFGGFAIGDLFMFEQLGFGLGVAILMDATIVRIIMVPAAMKLLGKWNWYFPSWLEWIPRIQIESRKNK